MAATLCIARFEALIIQHVLHQGKKGLGKERLLTRGTIDDLVMMQCIFGGDVSGVDAHAYTFGQLSMITVAVLRNYLTWSIVPSLLEITTLHPCLKVESLLPKLFKGKIRRKRTIEF